MKFNLLKYRNNEVQNRQVKFKTLYNMNENYN